MDSTEKEVDNIELVAPGSPNDTVKRNPNEFQDMEEVDVDAQWLQEAELERSNCVVTRAPCLKKCCSSEWFLFVLCLFVVCQTSISIGLFSSSISSLERRYNLSSTQTGLMSSIYDILVLVMCPVVSYYGGRATAHRPRVLAIFAAIMGISAIIFIMPQIAGSKYTPTGVSTLESIICQNFTAKEECGSAVSYAYGVLMLGMALAGFGASPVYTIGPAYLDEIIPKDKLSLYLGIFYGCSALGPAVGFVISSGLLNAWVDPGNKPSGITPTSKKWVGQWWGGYAIVAGILFFVAFLLGLYPKRVGSLTQLKQRHVERKREEAKKARRQRELEAAAAAGMGMVYGSGASTNTGSYPITASSGASETESVGSMDSDDRKNVAITEEERRSPTAAMNKPITVHPRTRAAGTGRYGVPPPMPTDDSLLSTLKFLFTSKTFMLCSLGSAFETFAVTGFSNFLPKAVESMFALPSSSASLTVGLIVIPGATGGIVVGGILLKKLRAGPMKTARVTWILALVACLLMFGFFLGCPSVPLAGVHVGYNPFNNNNNVHIQSPPALDNACNAGCGCKALDYSPVCGVDGVQYYNPCYAGCKNQTIDTLSETDDTKKKYFDCGCVARDPASPGPASALTATGGKCSDGCNNLGAFLGMLFVMMFVTFLNHIPATTVTLKSVPEKYRVFAMGLNNFIFRLLGSIPSPPIFGSVIDMSCTISQVACGITGACYEYDTVSLRNSFVLLAVLPKFLSFICFYFAARHFTFPYVDDDDVEDSGSVAVVIEEPASVPSEMRSPDLSP